MASSIDSQAVDVAAVTAAHAPAGATKRTSFALRGLSKRFPGVLAVDNVDLDVTCGQLHGVIGRNGAGKSILVSMIAGLIQPTAGKIEIAGQRVHARSYVPARARELGVVLIPQEPQFAGLLSITDNLFMGVKGASRFGWLRPKSRAARAGEIIQTLELEGVTPRMAMRDLSIESQQLLAFARSVYIDDARVILLDEITASLSRARKQGLLRLLRQLLQERPDLAFVLISHHISEVMEFCDRVSVMRDGRLVATPDVAKTSERELADWIVGDTAAMQPESQPQPSSRVDTANTVLSVRDLTLPRGLAPLSFELAAGEILGFAGLDGSGKERAMQALFGLCANAGGEIRMRGKPLRIDSPRAALAHGLVYLAKHREAEMVVQNLSVEENTLLSAYPRLVNRLGFIKGSQARHTAERLTADTGVKTRSLTTPIDFLSGGNKQKVMINRLALVEPSVFLLNEPTRGVDIASKPVLLATIRNQLSERTSVIVTSESEEEMISVSDRILVFFRGQVVATLRRGAPDFTVDHLYRTVQGVSAC